MGDWSIGSVADQIQNLFDDIPVGLSGTRLQDMADRQRQYVQDYTGVAIGSMNIGISYQDPILKLTMAEALRILNTLGADATSYTLGPLTVNKGGASNLIESSDLLRAEAMEQLKILGRKINFFKVNS